MTMSTFCVLLFATFLSVLGKNTYESEKNKMMILFSLDAGFSKLFR